MEKTRAQRRLEKRLRTQEQLKARTARATVQPRQQLKEQQSRDPPELGQLLRVTGFEDVPVEQTQRWLKIALTLTPLTVWTPNPCDLLNGNRKEMGWTTRQVLHDNRKESRRNRCRFPNGNLREPKRYP